MAHSKATLPDLTRKVERRSLRLKEKDGKPLKEPDLSEDEDISADESSDDFRPVIDDNGKGSSDMTESEEEEEPNEESGSNTEEGVRAAGTTDLDDGKSTSEEDLAYDSDEMVRPVKKKKKKKKKPTRMKGRGGLDGPSQSTVTGKGLPGEFINFKGAPR